jgi:elongation factor 1-alpha
MLFNNDDPHSAQDITTKQQIGETKDTKETKDMMDRLVTDKGFVVVGNVDAGKSTLIGCLSTGVLDNGRGSARTSVARHNHEIVSGKTSDISCRIIRFPNGKTASLIDLCGHDKYFTTTAYGISGMWPDYAIVVVSPTRGILPMTIQHFRMLMSYNIPVLFVVTKIDMAVEESCRIVDREIADLCKTYKRTVEFVNNYTKYHQYIKGRSIAEKQTETKHTAKELECLNTFLKFDADRSLAIDQIIKGLQMGNGKQNCIPVVYISNVNGYYLDVVVQAMTKIEPRDIWCKDENANIKFFRNKLNLPLLGKSNDHTGSTYYIDSCYMVKGVGLVVSGINRGDRISVNDDVYIGPIDKTFIRTKIKSIHNNNRENITYLENHHRGCVALKPSKDSIRRDQITKGMVLITDLQMIRNVCFRFEAAITIFGDNSTTFRSGYSPLIHAGTIRQVAKLILHETNPTDGSDKKDITQKIKSRDVAIVTFKFRIRPEYLEPNTIFVFRSGDIHGVGCVISCLSIDKDPDAYPEPLKKKVRKIRPSRFTSTKDKNIVSGNLTSTVKLPQKK